MVHAIPVSKNRPVRAKSGDDYFLEVYHLILQFRVRAEPKLETGENGMQFLAPLVHILRPSVILENQVVPIVGEIIE